MDFEIVRPNTLLSDTGSAPKDANSNCRDFEINVTCECQDIFCGNNLDCSFVAVGDGCQDVSINSLNP